MPSFGRVWCVSVALVCALMAASCEDPESAPSEDGATLIFARGDEEIARKRIPSGPSERITVDDPYYEKSKTFRAVPLLPLLMEVYGMSSDELARQDFMLEAIDGYAAPIPGSRITEPGAYLAYQDVEFSPGWEPVGPAESDPAPLYMIWIHEDQQNTSTHPRPWQLRRVAMVSKGSSREMTAPLGLDENHEAWAGYELFQQRCVQCHAVNRSGGRVGPELNVPMNITEYREREQTLRFIRNAQAFRYSQMPAFEDLSEAQLGTLWSYLEAMADRKKDPNSQGAEPPSDDGTEAM